MIGWIRPFTAMSAARSLMASVSRAARPLVGSGVRMSAIAMVESRYDGAGVGVGGDDEAAGAVFAHGDVWEALGCVGSDPGFGESDDEGVALADDLSELMEGGCADIWL